MKSRLDLSSMEVRTAPMVQCFTSLLIPGTAAGFHSLLPAKAAIASRANLRHMSSGPLMLGGMHAGKLHSFALADKPVYMEATLFKTGGGYQPTRRHIYLEASIEHGAGELTIRVHNGMVTFLRGPVRMLDQREAMSIFGDKLVKTTSIFNPLKDAGLLGVGLTGLAAAPSLRAVRTLDEGGNETEITIRRRRRAVEI